MGTSDFASKLQRNPKSCNQCAENCKLHKGFWFCYRYYFKKLLKRLAVKFLSGKSLKGCDRWIGFDLDKEEEQEGGVRDHKRENLEDVQNR